MQHLKEFYMNRFEKLENLILLLRLWKKFEINDSKNIISKHKFKAEIQFDNLPTAMNTAVQEAVIHVGAPAFTLSAALVI